MKNILIVILTLLLTTDVISQSIGNINGNNNPCKSQTENYTIVASQGTGTNKYHHIIWEFGDGGWAATGFASWPSNNIHTVSYTYKKSGIYTIKVTPYKDEKGEQPVAADTKTLGVKVSPCVIPVNPNHYIYNSK